MESRVSIPQDDKYCNFHLWPSKEIECCSFPYLLSSKLCRISQKNRKSEMRNLKTITILYARIDSLVIY